MNSEWYNNFMATEYALSYEELQELDIQAFNTESIVGNWTY